MTGFFTGISYVFKGLSLINQAQVKRFVIIPLLVNIVIFGGLIWFGAGLFNQFIDYLMTFLPSWLEWLSWIMWPVFALVAFIIAFYTFTMFANIIASPFNSLLAQRVEEHLTGVPSAESETSLILVLKEIVPAILGEIKKIVYFITRAIFILMITFIPMVNIISPIIWFIFSAWYLMLEYGDYPMGNHDIKFKDQLKTMRQYRATSYGFGITLSLFTMIPIINFISMPVGVCGATALWIDHWNKTG